MPLDATDATAAFDPISKADLPAFDDMWETVAEAYPTVAKVQNTFVKRVITCAVYARAIDVANAYFSDSKPASAEVYDPTLYTLALRACLEVVVAAQLPVKASADATGTTGVTGPPRVTSRCGQVMISVPIMVERAGTGFKWEVTGSASPARGRPPLSVSCKPTSSGLVLTAKPKRRGAKLVTVAGPKLNVGFANPTNQTVTLNGTYTFR
jgi:hypothetical protein